MTVKTNLIWAADFKSSKYGEQRIKSLLDAKIDHDGYGISVSETRPQSVRGHANAEVFFRHIENELCKKIYQYPAIVGCAAWLTSEKVLRALSTRTIVQIILQKEDFLRPDTGGWTKDKLRELYAMLPDTDRYSLRLGEFNACSDPSLPALLCAGVAANPDEIPPRMHHKFFVFGDINNGTTEDHIESGVIVPKAVWTGSYNPTQNANRSFENAVFLENEAFADAYFQEWKTIFGISEGLDWESPYVCPAFRVGT